MEIKFGDALSYIRNADEEKAKELLQAIISLEKANTFGKATESLIDAHNKSGDEGVRGCVAAMGMAAQESGPQIMSEIFEIMSRETTEKPTLGDNVVEFPAPTRVQ
jgi:hypothetical protein